MKKLIALAALAGAAAVANAQDVGTGKFTWEVSLDGGATWAGGVVDIDPSNQSVLVRARAMWDGTNGMYAFAGAQFDALVTTANSNGDTAGNFVRPGTVSGSGAQTIVATRFGNVLKIDDVRDTLGPGLGTRGVFPGQLVENFAGTNFSTANPITLFQYELFIDHTDESDRLLSEAFIAPTGGNTVDRVMRIYTSPTGGQNTPVTTRNNAVLRYIPTPATLALLGLGGLMVGRRRR